MKKQIEKIIQDSEKIKAIGKEISELMNFSTGEEKWECEKCHEWYPESEIQETKSCHLYCDNCIEKIDCYDCGGEFSTDDIYYNGSDQPLCSSCMGRYERKWDEYVSKNGYHDPAF